MPRARRPIAALACLTLLGGALPAHADPVEGLGRVRLERVDGEAPQPMMLHDRHHTAISKLPGPTRGQIRWVADLDGAVVGSGAVDAAGRSYWATLGVGQIHVLDPDGLTVNTLLMGDGTHSSPALGRDGSVYISTLGGDLIAFEPDGRERWRHKAGREILSSPLVDEPSGRVIFSAEDRTLGLDLRTGRLVFEYDARNGRNNSSPTLGPDGLIRITNWGGFAAAIAGSGDQVWKTPIGQHGFWASPTLGAFGTLYTAGRDGTIVALSPQGRILWHAQAPGNVSTFLGLTTYGHLIVPVAGHGVVTVSPGGVISWQLLLPGRRLSSTLSVTRDDTLYFSTYDGIIGAARIGEEELLWSVGTGEQMNSGPIIAPPTRGVARLYVGSRSGRVYCVE
ncbi:MAG: hypothetical protein CMH57_14690 [Myxococcales bacterium]|nr:hypothetical protein [Myxococcales bacterium]